MILICKLVFFVVRGCYHYFMNHFKTLLNPKFIIVEIFLCLDDLWFFTLILWGFPRWKLSPTHVSLSKLISPFQFLESLLISYFSAHIEWSKVNTTISIMSHCSQQSNTMKRPSPDLSIIVFRAEDSGSQKEKYLNFYQHCVIPTR